MISRALGLAAQANGVQLSPMKFTFSKLLAVLFVVCVAGQASPVLAQALQQTKGDFQDKFRQLDPEELPTPGDYRTASGAPGSRYWQQKVDYKIKEKYVLKSF